MKSQEPQQQNLHKKEMNRSQLKTSLMELMLLRLKVTATQDWKNFYNLLLNNKLCLI
jgi:hypothetical protein